ncbi:MAG: hypothetical protein IPH07_33245 [Deltaproteobacteria bacterium]|nr:hypothetical protein [Deltaproteobacteria bacterium]MBP7290183.1 hypothetical protein [Nannocystaceae bacterium]
MPGTAPQDPGDAPSTAPPSADADAGADAIADAPAETPPPTPERRRRGTIHMAYPDPERGWTVDIIDLEADAMGRALQAQAAAGESAPEFLPADAAVIPKGWRIGDTWTLVTRGGVLRRSVSGFRVEGGASEGHFLVVLGGAKTPATRRVVAIRGDDVPDTLRFTKPAKSELSLLGDDPVGAVRDAVLAAVPRDARSLFRRARIGKRHISVYAGRFGNGRTHVVILDAPLPAGEDTDLYRASAMLMRREDGSLEYVTRPGVDGWLAVRAVLDIDGDGIDEVFYDDEYYEGAYEAMLGWRNGEPTTRLLSGDGA